MYSKMLEAELNMTSTDRFNLGYKFKIQLQITDPNPLGDINQFIKKEEIIENKTFDGKKVLVVDDNTINIKLIERFLSELKMEVESVTSGNDCIAKVKEKDYDIIFLDHMMPVKDGVQTLNELKNFKQNLPPIIALTANSYSGVKDYYVNAGFKDYLAKPVNRGDLTSLLNKYL